MLNILVDITYNIPVKPDVAALIIPQYKRFGILAFYATRTAYILIVLGFIFFYLLNSTAEKNVLGLIVFFFFLAVN